MKIIIVSCVAPPETSVAGKINWDIAEYFSNLDNEIILISPYPSRPIGKFNSFNNNEIFIRNIKKNFTHIYINSFVYPKYSLLHRMYESFDFGLKSIKYINKFHSDSNLIYATLWPFIGQFIFLFFKKNKNISIVMNIQDLYPESFFVKIKSAIIKKVFSFLIIIDRYIANSATHLTVVSESIKNIYINNRKVSNKKITVLENWLDESLFFSRKVDKNTILEKYSLTELNDKFVYLYLGNIGPTAGIDELILASREILDLNRVLIIAGSGTEKEKCQELVKKLNIKNVQFIDIPTGIDAVVDLQSIADVLMLPIIQGADFSSIPSKLIAYMFSGKPIISSASSDSATGKAILQSKCGFIIDKDNTWKNQMLEVCLLPLEELYTIGDNGKKYALNMYSKSIGLNKVDKLFKEILF